MGNDEAIDLGPWKLPTLPKELAKGPAMQACLCSKRQAFRFYCVDCQSNSNEE